MCVCVCVCQDIHSVHRHTDTNARIAMSGLPGVVVMDHSDITNNDVHRKFTISVYLHCFTLVICSDMAPNATGMHEMDQHRIIV